ncbi:tetratricopeptide repeat protein [bacterium]|nr:tetratricopeptide repeat protein [bacterium]
MRRSTNIGTLLLLFASIPVWAQLPFESGLEDSSLASLSLTEIQGYKQYLSLELENLQEEKRLLIERGISDGERLLASQSGREMADQILIRLADLYYYRDKDRFLASMDAFDRALAERSEGLADSIPEEPAADFSQSISLYERLIRDFPQSELVDDALYNQAFLLEETGRNEEANALYRQLISRHPSSAFVPEAYMRLAEYHFNPPRNELVKAIDCYENVLRFRRSVRYEEALYKLGWSHYRLNRYPEAISTFTNLVENAAAAVKSGADASGLRDEAVEYIALSFMDFGGPLKAREYLDQIGRPAWGREVLLKLGDIYMEEKEEYENAIITYRLLLNGSRYHADAPLIQKKIVDCCRALDDEKRLFEARTELYQNYQAESPWWNAVADEKAQLAAYRLSEEALRENISTQLKMAGRDKSTALYRQAVILQRKYLSLFPEDMNAYMVRWNLAYVLDTRLQDYKEALEEYLTISLVYNEPKYEAYAREKALATIKEAAGNAIVVADTLVRREQRLNASADSASLQGAGRPGQKTVAQSERWLLMAYDNFLKLFPFDESTPAILANAGALHFSGGRYEDAIRYFKTLIRYFPDAKQVEKARYWILESYFGKGDYESTEGMCKRILAASPPPDLKAKAEQRLGEALFLKAKALSDSGQTRLAANEYRRMALEVPTLAFADRALFNAAREYERIREYGPAIAAYEAIRSAYAGSSYLRDATNNLAVNYGETGDFQKAGESYEALYLMKKDAPGAAVALFNAHASYVKAVNWEKAIETARAYAAAFPSATGADSVLFRTGSYFQRLNDDRGAREAYLEFTRHFPDSPLGIEALFRLGESYSKLDSLDRAEFFFMKAHEQNGLLAARSLRTNDFFAAEGLFRATILQMKKFSEIRFVQPESALKEAAAGKEKELKKLVDQFTAVIAYQTERLPESLYRIGTLYEDFAAAWAGQQLPGLDPVQKAVREKAVNERTAQLYEEAHVAFRSAMGGLGRILSDRAADAAAGGISDSLRQANTVWLEKSKEKVSETLFRIAEIQTSSVDMLLAVPVPSDLSPEASLEYRDQLLAKAIRPLTDVARKAHVRNIRVADSLSLSNTWTSASFSKILDMSIFLGRRYCGLSGEAMQGYSRALETFRSLESGASEELQEEWINRMVNMIDLSKSYYLKAVRGCLEGLQASRAAGAGDSLLAAAEAGLLEFVRAMDDTLQERTAEAMRHQGQAEILYARNADIRYESMLAAYEDDVYYLQEYRREGLLTAYQSIRDSGFAAGSLKELGMRLLRIDPDAFGKLVELPVETMTVLTDSTWKYSTLYQPGWQEPSFVQSGWISPVCGSMPDSLWGGASPFLLGRSDTIRDVSACYFRKALVIPGVPLKGEWKCLSDSCGILFCCGSSLPPENQGKTWDLSPYLREGENVFAIEMPCADAMTLGGGIRVRYVPRSAMTAQMPLQVR